MLRSNVASWPSVALVVDRFLLSAHCGTRSSEPLKCRNRSKGLRNWPRVLKWSSRLASRALRRLAPCSGWRKRGTHGLVSPCSSPCLAALWLAALLADLLHFVALLSSLQRSGWPLSSRTYCSRSWLWLGFPCGCVGSPHRPRTPKSRRSRS